MLSASRWPLCFVVALVLSGCDRGQTDSEMPAPRPSVFQPPPKASGSARVKLDPAVRYAMKLSPGPVSPQKLTLTRTRLARTVESGIELRDLNDLSIERVVPLKEVRGVVTLLDGSLLAAVPSGLRRIDPTSAKVEAFARATLFAGSVLIPDLIRPERVWINHRFGDTLYAYDLTESARPLLPIASTVDIEGNSGKSVAMMSGGAFFGATEAGFIQLFPGGTCRRVTGNSDGVLRVFRANNVEQVWVFREGGRVQLCHVSDRVRTITSIELESAPFAIAVDGALLAMVRLHQPDDAPKSFMIEVFDEAGTVRFRESLPADSSENEDWETTLANAQVALSAKPPRLFFGGPRRLVAWDLGIDPHEIHEPQPKPTGESAQ